MDKIINWYKSGMITEVEAIQGLEWISIHGAFRQHQEDRWFFIGYDYKNQVWITIE